MTRKNKLQNKMMQLLNPSLAQILRAMTRKRLNKKPPKEIRSQLKKRKRMP